MGRWTDIAEWRGPAADNFGDGDWIAGEAADRMSAHLGVVVHIADGTLGGTFAWEGNAASNISSHFIVGREGRTIQMVDTADRAWTQRSGNSRYLSIEFEGFVPSSPHYRPGWERLTDAQIKAGGRILAKAHQVYGVPLQLANADGERGLGHHSMGAGWGHRDCPGPVAISQKPAMVAWAKAIIAGTAGSEEDDDMPSITSYEVPRGFACNPAGEVIDKGKALVIALPAGERSGWPITNPDLSLSCDFSGEAEPVRVRVAICDGDPRKGGVWHIGIHEIHSGMGRLRLDVPPPRDGEAYSVSLCRVPRGDGDTTADTPVSLNCVIGKR